jgi:hypothetical protein
MSHNKDVYHLPASSHAGRTEHDELREVRDRTKSLNVTEDQLRRAVEKVGTSAKKVVEYFQNQR